MPESKKMNICHILGSLGAGGRESLLFDIIQKSGQETQHSVCCFQSDEGTEEEFRSLGAPVTSLRANSAFDFKAVWRLYAHLSSNDYSIVHAHGMHAQIPGRILSPLAGVGGVISTHHGRREIFPKKLTMLEYLTRPLDSATVAVSNGVKQSFIGRNHSGNWRVIQNGIDVKKFNKKVADAVSDPLYSKHSLNKEATTFLSIGRFVSEKSHDDLIAAMEILDTRASDINLIIIGGRGSRDYMEDLRDQAALKGVSDNISIIWRIPRSKIYQYFSLSDVFVSASVKEGLPIVLLEAMAAGLPVIATQIPGVREVINNGETGELVPTESPRALAAQMEKFTDETRRRTYGDRGYRRVSNHFDIKQTVSEYTALYKNITDYHNLCGSE